MEGLSLWRDSASGGDRGSACGGDQLVEAYDDCD